MFIISKSQVLMNKETCQSNDVFSVVTRKMLAQWQSTLPQLVPCDLGTRDLFCFIAEMDSGEENDNYLPLITYKTYGE